MTSIINTCVLSLSKNIDNFNNISFLHNTNSSTDTSVVGHDNDLGPNTRQSHEFWEGDFNHTIVSNWVGCRENYTGVWHSSDNRVLRSQCQFTYVTRHEVFLFHNLSHSLVSNSLGQILVFENLNEKLSSFLDHIRGRYSVDDDTSIGFFSNTIKVVATFEEQTWTGVIENVGNDLISAQSVSHSTFEETLGCEILLFENEVRWVIEFNVAS
jgi:hypothetical protein